MTSVLFSKELNKEYIVFPPSKGYYHISIICYTTLNDKKEYIIDLDIE